MAFNNYAFILFFLPTAMAGYHWASKVSPRAGIAWLVLVSVAFYCIQSPAFITLLLGSLCVNYWLGYWIDKSRSRRGVPQTLLVCGILVNLAGLCAFKYLIPLLLWLHVGSLNEFWRSGLLPLGISFFTFAQIGFLVDLKQGSTTITEPLHYVLFGMFFPHITAGPILRGQEFTPQLRRLTGLRSLDVALGFSYFAMGLFKKAIGDIMASDANQLYDNAGHASVAFAWVGMLSYSMQLYFDFAGYSDMAIGLARMFSIRYPFNFDSPYKATSIIDFWRRWHITLTRYITVYIYTPLSMWMSRREVRRGRGPYKKMLGTLSGFSKLIAFPTMTTMFLAGIWHGAGLQFIVFGLLHGFYISVNHAWRIMFKEKMVRRFAGMAGFRLAARTGSLVLVFVSVMVAQVFFRASSCQDANAILANALGASGQTAKVFVSSNRSVYLLVLLVCFTLVAPNTQQVLESGDTTVAAFWLDLPRWRPTMPWAVGVGGLLACGLYVFVQQAGFLYSHF